jgi:S-adenosyl-L-methionine hydrolase (adenosine-forming)
VHVAVVDPGVGSTRRGLAAALDGQYFLLPDNGLLPERLVEAPGARVLAVDVARHGLTPRSATFHGRDVFAPLAADLAGGALDFDALGEPVQPLPCELARPTRDALAISGEVVTIDHFGNLLTNLDEVWLADAGIRHATVAGRRVPLRRTYSEAQPGELIVLVNAFGVLEIAERDGSAERTLGVGRGAAVQLPLEPAPGA